MDLRLADAEKRATAWAKRLEIDEALPKKTEELSKGMQQKIQFIGSLLHEPGLIVMDEPFSGLDPVNAKLLEQTLLDSRTKARPSSFPLIAWTRSRSSATPSASSIKGRRCSRDGYVRSSPATSGTTSSWSSKAATNFFHSPEIAEAKNFSGHAEIQLKAHGDAQKLLREASAMAKIYRFELVEPSLEEIFIQTVGGNVDA